MGVTSKNTSSKSGVTPSQRPAVEPPQSAFENHSWMFQAVMEINKGIGALQKDVEHISKKTDTLESKVGKLGDYVKYIGGAAAIIALIFTFVPAENKTKIINALFFKEATKQPTPK